MVPIVPKNGKWLVALIVGAPEHLYRRVREDLMKRASIVAPYHVEDCRLDHFSRLVPKPDVDLAIIITDGIGHPASVQIRRRFKEMGVPCLFGNSHWSKMYQTIYRLDYPRPEIPLAVQTSLIKNGEGLEQPKSVAPQPPTCHIQVAPAEVIHIPPKESDQVYMLAREVQERIKITGQSVLITGDSITIETTKGAQ